MSTRSRKHAQIYSKHLKKSDKKICDFCAIGKDSVQYISETKSFKILNNIFPYSLWDGLTVEDHLLIVPKIHTDTLSDLSPEESKEFIKLISKYELKGYNVYARAPGSIRKTVAHQHTHLIKTKGKVKKLVFTIYRPFYFRIPR